MRLPSELTHRRFLRAASDRCARPRCGSPAPARAARSATPGRRAGRPTSARDRAGSRNSAWDTNASKSASDMPACCALACVGHSVVHQRFFSVCSRIGRRARVERASRSGSMPASARVFSGAWMASVACDLARLGQREVAVVVQLPVARMAVEALGLAGQLDAQVAASRHAPGSRAAAPAAAARPACRAHEHVLALLHLQAVAGQQVGEAAASITAAPPARRAGAAEGLRPGAPSPITPMRHTWPASGPRPPLTSIPCSAAARGAPPPRRCPRARSRTAARRAARPRAPGARSPAAPAPAGAPRGRPAWRAQRASRPSSSTMSSASSSA